MPDTVPFWPRECTCCEPSAVFDNVEDFARHLSAVHRANRDRTCIDQLEEYDVCLPDDVETPMEPVIIERSDDDADMRVPESIDLDTDQEAPNESGHVVPRITEDDSEFDISHNSCIDSDHEYKPKSHKNAVPSSSLVSSREPRVKKPKYLGLPYTTSRSLYGLVNDLRKSCGSSVDYDSQYAAWYKRISSMRNERIKKPTTAESDGAGRSSTM